MDKVESKFMDEISILRDHIRFLEGEGAGKNASNSEKKAETEGEFKDLLAQVEEQKKDFALLEKKLAEASDAGEAKKRPWFDSLQ